MVRLSGLKSTMVSKGKTNGEVAAEPYVSVTTVEYRLRDVFAKLGSSPGGGCAARALAAS